NNISQENFSSENPYVNEMQITSQLINTSLSSSLEFILQNTDLLGQDSLANTVTDAASNNIIKEASNSGLTENSDSSEVKKNNNMKEVTFTTNITDWDLLKHMIQATLRALKPRTFPEKTMHKIQRKLLKINNKLATNPDLIKLQLVAKNFCIQLQDKTTSLAEK
ncbi:9162_t:CDS:2, partial [Cetraspora pellucida]